MITDSKPPLLYLIISHDVFRKVYIYPQTFSSCLKTSFSKNTYTKNSFHHFYRIISKMAKSLTCLPLGKTSFDDTFVVDLAYDTLINNVIIKINDLKISNLKFLIYRVMNSETTEAKFNYNDMILWKVSIPENEEYRLEGVNENNINDKLYGEKLRPNHTFVSYFPVDSTNSTDIDIIVQVPATTGKCLPKFYLSNKKFAVTKYRFGLISFFSR